MDHQGTDHGLDLIAVIEFIQIVFWVKYWFIFQRIEIYNPL
jgi:hypothetical protein